MEPAWRRSDVGEARAEAETSAPPDGPPERLPHSTGEVYQILFEGKAPRAAVTDLMLRSPKVEWQA